MNDPELTKTFNDYPYVPAAMYTPEDWVFSQSDVELLRTTDQSELSDYPLADRYGILANNRAFDRLAAIHGVDKALVLVGAPATKAQVHISEVTNTDAVDELADTADTTPLIVSAFFKRHKQRHAEGQETTDWAAVAKATTYVPLGKKQPALVD